LNQIWALQRLLTNHFAPQQKLVSKTRIGAKIIKKYDAPKTPFHRVLDDSGTVRKSVKTQLAHQNKQLNPAAIQRQIRALTEQLLTLTPSKKGPKPKPSTRALSHDFTKTPHYASTLNGSRRILDMKQQRTKLAPCRTLSITCRSPRVHRKTSCPNRFNARARLTPRCCLRRLRPNDSGIERQRQAGYRTE
jgi:hypothetical protein